VDDTLDAHAQTTFECAYVIEISLLTCRWVFKSQFSLLSSPLLMLTRKGTHATVEVIRTHASPLLSSQFRLLSSPLLSSCCPGEELTPRSRSCSEDSLVSCCPAKKRSYGGNLLDQLLSRQVGIGQYVHILKQPP